MEGRLVLALLVCLVLAEYSWEKEIFNRDEIQKFNFDEVSLEDEKLVDETLNTELEETLPLLKRKQYGSKIKKPKTSYAKGKEISVITTESPISCPENSNKTINGTFYLCRNGSWVTCRVRREFATSLTATERAEYIETVKQAANSSAFKDKYEELLTTHKEFFTYGIHHGENNIRYFLPWHRWYILQYENLLREVNPNIAAVYWDWTLDSDSPFESKFWGENDTWFGGNGELPEGCVITGPFRNGQFSVISSAGGGCLRRRFDFAAHFPSPVYLERLLRIEDFFNFEEVLESSFHDEIHNNIGAIMSSYDAASTPEFFLHHVFVDKIWSEWQKRWNNDNYYLGVPYIMPASCVLPKEVLNLSYQLGDTCVVYEEPNTDVHQKLKDKSDEELDNVKTRSLPKISEATIQLFKIPQTVLEAVSRFRNKGRLRKGK